MEPDLIGQEKLKPGSVIARGIPPQWSLTSSVRKSINLAGWAAEAEIPAMEPDLIGQEKHQVFQQPGLVGRARNGA